MNLSKYKFLFLASIVIISAIFRLYRIEGYMEFLGDQGRDVVVVRQFLTKNDFIAIGPQTSIGNMYLGPWFYYLIAPALLLSNYDPVGPAILVALFGIATTILIYKFASKLFDCPVGLISALIYAISPVAIKYTSFSWNPNIMPFFALLFAYSIYQLYLTRHHKYLIMATIAFIMCLNSHYLALLLLPLGLFYLFLLLKDKHLSIKPLILAGLIFIISLIPQVLFDIKHQGQNLKAITTFFTVRQTTVNLKPYKAIPQIIPLFNQLTTRYLTGKDITMGTMVAIYLLIFIPIIFYLKKQIRPQLIFLFIWLLSGLIGLALYKQHIYDHYFGFLYPSLIIISALAIRNTKILGIVILILISIYSFKENPLNYPPNRQSENVEAVSKLIISQSHNQPFNLALLAKQNYDPPYRYFLDLYSAPVKTLHQLATQQLFVVCELPVSECQPVGNPFWDVAAFGMSKIDQQWTYKQITIYRLIPNTNLQSL